MTVGAEPQPAEHTGVPSAARCARCGVPLAEDQEWCLECGAARTVIHRPGSWRIPAAVLATVALLVLAAFVIALVDLSSEANRSAAAVQTSTAQSAPAPAATPSGSRR
jgi:uncharacterized OB-fold protein